MHACDDNDHDAQIDNGYNVYGDNDNDTSRDKVMMLVVIMMLVRKMTLMVIMIMMLMEMMLMVFMLKMIMIFVVKTMIVLMVIHSIDQVDYKYHVISTFKVQLRYQSLESGDYFLINNDLSFRLRLFLSRLKLTLESICNTGREVCMGNSKIMIFI